MLEAVDSYAFGDDMYLEDQFNVIVFSAQGDRPQFNKMSNGDLDGDTYLAIWDEDLTKFIEPENCFEPDNNIPENPDDSTDLGRPEEDQIVEFLLWFFYNDLTGIVNNLHLAYCDLLGQDGPSAYESQVLAHMCNVAIDFGKHG